MQVLHGGPPGPIYALYGAREALLLPPLPLADDSAVHAFLDACLHAPAVREGFRQALIAQGTWALHAAGLRAQAADALKSGVLRVAPIPVSGLAPLKTEPAKAELSGKPFVMPPRINPPRTPEPPAPRHKVSIEIAGQHADGLVGVLVVRSVADPKFSRILSTHKQGTDTHRLVCSVSGLPDTPFDLYYDISMQGGAPMRYRDAACTAALVRHPPAVNRGRPPPDPGIAGPRLAIDDAGLYRGRP